jgi:hypothetical protein
MTQKNYLNLFGIQTEKYNTFKEHAIECMKIINDVSKETRFLMAICNPVIFGEYYIKPYIKNWDSKTADFHYDMIENCLRYKDIVIHVPVEHAKSTWMSLVYPLWYLANNINANIAIISDTARQAKGFLHLIKMHLEENSLLKKDIPYLMPDYNKKWTESEIFVVRDIYKQSKDPSILAIGAGGGILGARLDLVIADDVCNLDNSSTEHNREKMLNWWDEIINSRVVEDGKKIVLGTLQNSNDLLCTLSDRGNYKYVHFKAFDEENNTSLWPEKWSIKRLINKRNDIGLIKFNKVMQNDRKSKATKVLDINWLKFYGGYRKIQLPPQYELDIYISFDPAISDDKETAIKNQLDKCCIAVHGLCKITKNIFLIEYYQEYLTFPEQLKIIDKYWLKYQLKCKGIGVESTAYQKALAQQAYLLESLPPIIPVQVGTQSKTIRLESFAVYSEIGRYFILETHNEFIQEWEDYEPGGKSPNVLDACSVGVIMMTQKKALTKDQKELINSITF